MLFHEPAFLYVFLPVVLGLFLLARRLGRDDANPWLLLAASFLFYGWWDARFVPLLALSIAANHALGRAMSRRAETGALLALGVAGNLAALGLFKYLDFLIDTLNAVSGTSIARAGLPLPLGISFFTFLQIAYVVDCARHQGGAPSWRDYGLFVAYFPHLIAGPLVHHRELIPQFARRVPPDEMWENIAVGSTIFLIGLAKKTLLAQPAGSYADNVFNAAAAGTAPSFLEAWIGALAFAFQIYFDFSAYTDMAIGLSRLFGIWLPVNFDSPYKATSIIEFWRRWHMTLSRFLRDYLYVPLGGGRRGAARRYLNLAIVMLLGGLWHGAAWTFVIWGAMHGSMLAINHAWRALRERVGWTTTTIAGSWIARAATFALVVIAWVPFRADGLATTLSIWRGLGGANGLRLPDHYAEIAGLGRLATLGVDFAPMPLYGGGWQMIDLALLLAIVWLLPNTQELMRRFAPALGVAPADRAHGPAWRPGALLGAATGVAAIVLFARTLQRQPGEFIYFQF